MKQDDYANIVTGLGTGRDKSTGAAILGRGDLTSTELDVLYEQDAIAARIVDRIIDDATREGFEIRTQEDFDRESVMSEIEDLGLLSGIGDAARWARLYGGSLLFPALTDGLAISEPLDPTRIKKVIGLTSFESPCVTPEAYNPGVGARAFRNPDRYSIGVAFSSGAPRVIHRSRVFRFDGVKVPPSRLVARGGWGPSVLDRVIRELARLGQALGYGENILHDISTMVLKIQGFRDMASGTSEEQESIKQVLENLRWTIDNLHALPIDSRDEYLEQTRTVSGISELIDIFENALARVTDYPAMILFNQRAEGSGLANSAGSELANYYDHVHSFRTRVLTPAINWVLDLVFAARANRREKVPTKWTIEFDPLYQESEKEKSETDLRKAQAAQIWILNQIKAIDEVRKELGYGDD